MLTFDYLKRLGLHGSRLLWRVFMILAPVIGYSFWRAVREMLAGTENVRHDGSEEHGVFADGTPWLENSSHSQWEAYYNDSKKGY